MKPHHTRWLLAIATLACLAPFVNKAFHTDDPLFLWTAQHVITSPGDPYGFDVNWYGQDEPMHTVTKNPPLTSYYLAAFGAVLGFGEPVMHIALWLPAIGAVLGTYQLARRLCPRPMVAALLMLFSPVYLMSATTVMSDVLMLCAYVWSVYLWTSGLEPRSRPPGPVFNKRLIGAAVLAGVAALTKYFAVSLLPLLLVYTLVRQRGLRRDVAWLLIPVTILGLYQWWTHGLYGHGLLLDAVDYARTERSQGSRMWSLLTALAFVGGCLLPVLLVTPIRRLTAVVIIAALLLLLIATATAPTSLQINLTALHTDGQLNLGYALQMAVLAAAGVGVLILPVNAYRRKPDADTLLLLLWLYGTFIFAALVNWTIAGRNVLPMAVAASILAARQIKAPPRRLAGPIAVAALLAVLITYADTTLANASRQAARGLASSHTKLWYQGHWGFQYYMDQLGAADVKFSGDNRSRPRVGDLIVLPDNNTNIRTLSPRTARHIETRTYRVFPWLATLHYDAGAGFYSDRSGALPFAVGRTTPIQHWLLRFQPPPGDTR